MEKRARLILKYGKEKSLYRRHPWVFSGAVQRVEGKPAAGDLADVFTADGRYLATGHYQNDSIILKVLRFGTPEIDAEFWREKLSQALAFRETLGLWKKKDTNVFRLIHSEGDGLSGLIADYYNGILVLQSHSEGTMEIPCFRHSSVLSATMLCKSSCRLYIPPSHRREKPRQRLL